MLDAGTPGSLLAPLAVVAGAAAAGLALPPPQRLRDHERPAGPDGRPPGDAREGRALRWSATAAVTVATALLVGGAAGAAVSVVAGAVCWWLVGRLEPPSVRRRRERLAAAVPHAVDLLAACLAAGLAPGAALEQITAAVGWPLADELEPVVGRLRLGVDPATVWRDLAEHPQLGGLGRALTRATESGASVSDAMLRLAEDLRRRSRAEAENRARAVGVKAAIPLGICLLPAFVLVGVVPLVAGALTVLLGH